MSDQTASFRPEEEMPMSSENDQVVFVLQRVNPLQRSDSHILGFTTTLDAALDKRREKLRNNVPWRELDATRWTTRNPNVDMFGLYPYYEVTRIGRL